MSDKEYFIVNLPYPPSNNVYYRRGKHKTYLNDTARAYHKEVFLLLNGVKLNKGRYRVEMTTHAPDNRRRDLDNLPKAVLDSIKKAGVWEDDHLVDELIITRGEICRKKPMITVKISIIG